MGGTQSIPHWRLAVVANYALSPQVILRCEHFGGLVFHRESWAIHKLNQTGYEILELLARQTVPRERIHQLLSSTYGELDGTQRHAVDMFLDQSLALGIIVEELEDHRGSEQAALESSGNVTRISRSKEMARHLSAPTSLCNE